MSEFFLHGFNTLSHGLIGYAIPFLFVLTLVVFFHELGHFLVARWAGVKVLTFSLGFGPELAGFNDRHGTRWKISAVPLGGYVKFFGDDSEASTPAVDALAAMTDEEKAGSFTCLFTFFGKPITSARVDKVEANSAAAAAGFQTGDIVTAIDGTKIETFPDMQRIVATRAGERLTFTVKRGEDTVQLQGTPELREVKDPFGNSHRQGVLGITRQTVAGDAVTERVNPATALWLGVNRTWFVVDQTLSYIGRIFTGREAADQVGGPLRIAQISGQVATIGLAALIDLAAVLSISIGLLNLFPVPLLDGGHLLFYAVEAARGRPLSERAQEMGFRIGLGLVLMLMVFATYNDILHLAAS
jgi:regulator of sigma E protease